MKLLGATIYFITMQSNIENIPNEHGSGDGGNNREKIII